ncbi:tryptophan 2,3-dioxygenase [Bradyrhizobium sp. USDA 4354]
MRQIVSWTIIAALIAASASQVGATQSHRHVREQSATNEHIRNARNAIAQPPQSSWQYSS